MNTRRWTLVGTLGALALAYAFFFTEWLRPAPIAIVSQVRFSIQPPRFDRPVKKAVAGAELPQTNRPVHSVHGLERIGQPVKGVIDPAPGGVANVTFSFDATYQLTRVRVQDLPADGSPPTVMWEITGKSRPTSSLLYGRIPTGMQPVGAATNAEPLIPGAPYRLSIQAGRRRGTNQFTTVALRPIE